MATLIVLSQRKNLSTLEGEGSNQHPHHEENWEPKGGAIRSLKIDFHRFNGEDPTSWIYKANHFFVFYNEIFLYKLRLASFHMEVSRN